MSYSFDKVIDRAGTDCFKYDFREEIFGTNDVIPLWVADMDFEVPEFVSEAIIKRTEHAVYGYSVFPKEFFEAIINWEKDRHGWQIEKEWIVHCPGIVTAINLLVQELTEPGDGIIVQPPVYFPFFGAAKNNGRKLLYNELIETDGKWTIDFTDLEDKLKQGAKMLILCSPHNPVGRVWTREELKRMGDLCVEHNAWIISDEIHCDLLFEGYVHTPIAGLSEEISNRTITCLAASKTFNLAGLFTSYIVSENDEVREKFKKAVERLHLASNLFGMLATKEAFTSGAAWVDSLMDYLKGNAELVRVFLAENLPKIKLTNPEATYLLWLDFRELGLDDKEIRRKLIEEAGIGLNDGRMFGPGGPGFQRMNIGCRRAILEEALENLRKAFS